MSPISIESLNEFDQAQIDEIGMALPPTDPQLALFVEQMQEANTVTATPSVFFLARNERAFAGYGRTRQRSPNSAEWLFDVILAPQSQDELESTATAIITAARQQLEMPIIEWWTRGIAESVAARVARHISLHRERTILRMELDLTSAPEPHPVPTQGFVIDDAPEIVRVNNDAFQGHPDRSNIDIPRLMNDFDTGDHRYDNLRVFRDEYGITAGFIWVKEQLERYGEIYVLALDSAHQRMGYGRGLLDAGVEYLRATYSPKRALLYVESNNQHAIDVYSAYGFADVHQSLVSFSNRTN